MEFECSKVKVEGSQKFSNKHVHYNLFLVNGVHGEVCLGLSQLATVML